MSCWRRLAVTASVEEFVGYWSERIVIVTPQIEEVFYDLKEKECAHDPIVAAMVELKIACLLGKFVGRRGRHQLRRKVPTFLA